MSEGLVAGARRWRKKQSLLRRRKRHPTSPWFSLEFKYLISMLSDECGARISRNIVATAKLTKNDEKLDLKRIAQHAQNAEYNPKVHLAFDLCNSLRGALLRVLLILRQRFTALIMRIREPNTTALVFPSGKIVCTGAKRFVLSCLISMNDHDCDFCAIAASKMLRRPSRSSARSSKRPQMSTCR